MRRFTWGVDGYGRKTVCFCDLSFSPYGIACPFNCTVYELIDLLFEQGYEGIKYGELYGTN